MMNFLPPELLTKIFSHLDTVSIGICQQVCHRWRILSANMVNPFYLPGIMARIIQKLYTLGHLRDTLKVRLVCKLWKQGMDELTVHEDLLLNALTSVEPQLAIDSLIHPWNPFPSRIVRLQLCYGHDDLSNAENQTDNVDINTLMENYGVHIKYLQVSLQHANCAEKHLVKILNLLKNLKGLVISECLSPHRFSRKSTENSSDAFTLANIDELEQLENLKYFKLDDCDCKLKYANLYMNIIEKAQHLEHLEINGWIQSFGHGNYKLARQSGTQ